MNMNDLHQVWNSNSNQLSQAGARTLAQDFTRRIKRRRRFQAAWLIWTFLALSAVSLLAIRGTARGMGHTDLEWSLLLLLILPWAFAFKFLRRFLHEGASMPCGELSLTATLQAARSSANARRQTLTTRRSDCSRSSVFIVRSPGSGARSAGSPCRGDAGYRPRHDER